MERTKSDKRFYFGVILIAVGVVLILERLNLIPESMADMLISWQMLLVGIGAISLVGGNRKGGVILMIIGAFFLFPHEIRADYWPLILIAIGITILLQQHDHNKPGTIYEPVPDEVDDKATKSSGSFNTFDDFVIFGGREIFVTSQALSGGKATSIFGGIEFDLRKASLQPGGAVIDCVSVFGGCGFKIPMDWNVRNEVTTIFGAFTDKRGDTYNDRYYDPSKTLVIKGISMFGGIEVKHF
jgi:predicted membrane protein